MTQLQSEAKMLHSVDTWLMSAEIPCLETTKLVPQLISIHKKVFSDLESRLALSVQKASIITESKNHNKFSALKPSKLKV